MKNNMGKVLIALLTTTSIGVSTATVASAQTTTSLEINKSAVSSSQEPFVSGGQTYVPVSAIGQKMGAKKVQYISSQRKVIITEKNGMNITVQNGSNVAYVNGHVEHMATKAIVKNGTLFVPLSFISARNGMNYPVKTENQSGKTVIYVGTAPSTSTPSAPKPSNNSGGGQAVGGSQTYPDGWTAPVLTTQWSPALAQNNEAGEYKVFQAELGFGDGGGAYSIPGEQNIITIANDNFSPGSEVTIIFKGWGPDNYNPNWTPGVPDMYRIPVVSKQLFKFYFGSSYMTVWNYINSGNIPDKFTLNGRQVVPFASSTDGTFGLVIGYPNKPL